MGKKEFNKWIFKTIFFPLLMDIFCEVFISFLTIRIAFEVGVITDNFLNGETTFILNFRYILILLGLLIIITPFIQYINYMLWNKNFDKLHLYTFKKFLYRDYDIKNYYNDKELTYKLEWDTALLGIRLWNFLPDIITGLFILMYVGYNLIKLSISLGTITILISSIIILIPLIYRSKVKKQELFTQEINEKLTKTYYQLIENIPFIKVKNLYKQARLTLSEKYRNRYKIDKNSHKIECSLSFFNDISKVVLNIGLFLLGLYFVSLKHLTVGDLARYMIIINLLENGFIKFYRSLPLIEKIKVSYKRSIELLYPSEKGKTKLNAFYNLSFNNVSYGYNRNDNIIKNLFFTINRGDIVALVGKNGAGKSTIAKILTKLLTNYQGNILLNNIELKDINPENLRDLIIYCTQSPQLFNGTVYENIKIVDKCDSCDKDIITYMKDFNLYEIKDKIVEDNGNNLSGGQRQAIMLARVFLKAKDVLILDEPLNFLDLDKQKVVFNYLSMCSQKGKTVIMITHNSKLINFANKIIRLSY